MLDFMIVALPRSGTAWAANFMTTERSLCWHEPLADHDLADLDKMKMTGLFGIADTQLSLFDPSELNAHPARKLIIHRDFGEIARSLNALSLAPFDDALKHLKSCDERMYEVEGWHMPYPALFEADSFKPAFQWLTNMQFDRARHAVLKSLNVQNRVMIQRVQQLVEALHG